MATWNGRAFEFIPKIGFFFWNVTLDEKKRIHVEPSRLTTIYEHRDRYGLFATFVHGGRKISSDLLQTGILACYLAGMLPLHEDFDPGLGRKDIPDIHCKFYFLGFAVSVQTGTGLIAVCVPSDNDVFKINNLGDLPGTSLVKKPVEALIRLIDPEAIWC